MRRLIHLAVGLYPTWWRKRYARELDALLDDLEPGSRELIDIVTGALAMQSRSLALIPVGCALVGTLIGGLIAARTPHLYASSSTIRFDRRDDRTAESASAQPFRASLEKALSGADRRGTTSVTLLSADSEQTTVKLTYADRDPVEAQRVAENLTAALGNRNSGHATSSQILDAPALPTSAAEPNYPVTLAFGGAAGLVVGGVAILFLRRRYRESTN